jgi:hypothetical protein
MLIGRAANLHNTAIHRSFDMERFIAVTVTDATTGEVLDHNLDDPLVVDERERYLTVALGCVAGELTLDISPNSPEDKDEP